MKRVLAILGAGLMIVVALVVRNGLGDGDDDGDGGGDATSLSVVCASELRAACDAVGGATEDASATVTALGLGDSTADVWLTFEPWGEIANSAADRTVAGAAVGVASTQLAVVIWRDRATELPCAAAITWTCLGEAGGKPWADLGSHVPGEVLVGLPPNSSALGLVLLGNAAAGFFGTTDFGTNDLAINDAYAPWLNGITSGGTEDDPLTSMLTVGRAKYAAVGTTDAAANTSLGAHESEVQVLHPDPPAVVRVVLVPVNGTTPKQVERLAGSDALADALRAAGFGVPGAKASTGLPDADVLQALRAK